MRTVPGQASRRRRKSAWKRGESERIGHWSTVTREIVVNPASLAFDDFETMANTVFRENTHNHQLAMSGYYGGLKNIRAAGGPAKLGAQIRLFRANWRHYLYEEGYE